MLQSGSDIVLGEILKEIRRPQQAVRIRFYQKYVTKEIHLLHNNEKHNIRVEYEKNFAQMLLNHDHPNVVKTYQVQGTEEYTLIIMEKCQCNLAEYFSRVQGSIRSEQDSDKLMVRLIRQITEGYKFIKQLNPQFIHRDLTVDNILVSFINNKPIFKISDFGIARNLADSMTQKSQANQYYNIYPRKSLLAPEFMQTHYTTKIDIYSLGMIVYLFLENPTLRSLNTDSSNVFTRNNNLTQLVKQMIQTSETLRISWEELYAHPIMHLKPRVFIGDVVDNSNSHENNKQQRLGRFNSHLSTVASLIDFDRSYYDQITFINRKFTQVRQLDSVFTFQQIYVLGEIWQETIIGMIQKLETDQINKSYCLQTFINPIEQDQNRLIQANIEELFTLMTKENQRQQLKQIISLLNKINSRRYKQIINIIKQYLKKYEQ